MVDRLSCDRCGYSTNTIKCMKNHLNRKSICPPLQSYISVDEVRSKLFEHKKEYVCEKCDKSFSYRSGKSRHSKTCNQPVKDPIHPKEITTNIITQKKLVDNVLLKWKNMMYLMIDDLEQEAEGKTLRDSLKPQIERDVDIYERLREIFYDGKKTHHIS